MPYTSDQELCEVKIIKALLGHTETTNLPRSISLSIFDRYHPHPPAIDEIRKTGADRNDWYEIVVACKSRLFAVE